MGLQAPGKGGKAVSDLLMLGVFVAVWFVASRFVLPRFGVST